MTSKGSLRRDPSPNRNPEFLLGRSLEPTPLWLGLYRSVRDALFPTKLPPLELTSIPIAIPDRMAVRTNPWAFGTATIVNGALLALVLGLGIKAVLPPAQKSSRSHIDLSDLLPFTPSRIHTPSGGSGGGSNDLTDPIQGRLPKFEKTPLAPLQLPVLDHPTVAIDPALAAAIKLPDGPTLPNIGVHNSPNVTLLSGGPGTHGGIGTGSDGGLGPNKGIGFGPGPEGLYSPGGDVTSPVPIATPEAEFSDEARRAKYQGVCMISVIIDAHGNPQNARVLRSLGMGLDEKALEAVRKYRFKPALRQGRPVAVLITVAVNFRLF